MARPLHRPAQKEVKRSHESRKEAEAWVERMRLESRTGIDPEQTLASSVGGLRKRWARGNDRT